MDQQESLYKKGLKKIAIKTRTMSWWQGYERLCDVLTNYHTFPLETYILW
jgi:hypothetical protein